MKFYREREKQKKRQTINTTELSVFGYKVDYGRHSDKVVYTKDIELDEREREIIINHKQRYLHIW